MPEMEQPSFLFGTMHVKDQRAFRYQQQVYECIRQCDAFALEFDLREADAGATANMMDLPAGMSLQSLLRPKHYKKLRKIFKKSTGIDLAFFNHSQPILITNLLTESILSSDKAIVLDHQLWQYASQLEKLTLGIESFEEQMQILQQISIEDQLKSLVSAAKNFKRFRHQILRMTDLYAEGNIQKLHKSARKSLKGMRRLMLYDRNERMAERIALLAGEQSICVAIGAGHLAGKKGVLSLLKQRGACLRPIPLSPADN